MNEVEKFLSFLFVFVFVLFCLHLAIAGVVSEQPDLKKKKKKSQVIDKHLSKSLLSVSGKVGQESVETSYFILDKIIIVAGIITVQLREGFYKMLWFWLEYMAHYHSKAHSPGWRFKMLMKHAVKCCRVSIREDYQDMGLNKYKIFISQQVATLGVWDPTVGSSLFQGELLSTASTSWVDILQ